jgi:hypothetical protein
LAKGEQLLPGSKRLPKRQNFDPVVVMSVKRPRCRIACSLFR